MESVAEQILYNILLKLPTSDVARCRCVCEQWRRVIGDPSFRRLHANAAHVISGAGVEALLVRHTGAWGMTQETTVYSVRPTRIKQMCLLTDLAEGYNLAGVCNGFIVLASGRKEDPVFVCNPVTGEKFEVPAPPASRARAGTWHLFAMGFSSPAHQYKLFRIPLQESSVDGSYLNVYTFGGDDLGWRRRLDLFTHPVCRARSPPVLIDGKLFVVTKQTRFIPVPEKLLVIDVASEAYRTYSVPEYQAFKAEAIEVFELDGQPCVAMNTDRKLCLWVMPMPQFMQGGRQQLENTWHGDWVRRYILVYRNNPFSVNDEPSGIWVDGNGILGCLINDAVYKYNTTKDSKGKEECNKVCFLVWHHRLWLPSPTFQDNRGLRTYGGYRPTLLSPGHLAAGQHVVGGEVL